MLGRGRSTLLYQRTVAKKEQKRSCKKQRKRTYIKILRIVLKTNK